MHDATQPARAERLLALHRGPSPLVIVNVWDVVSARAVAAAGAAAVGTSSAAMAWALGGLDGTGRPAAGFFDVVARIADAVVPLPLTVDVEAGFGTSPLEVAATVRRVLAAGAVGINLEDVAPAAGAGAALFGIEDQQLRLRTARAAAEAFGVALVINARTDVFLAGIGAEEGRVDEAVRRATAYRAAGADSIFVPGVTDAAVIGELVRRIDAPLNVLAGPGTPPVAELAALGVARVSLGSWPARAVLERMQRMAGSVLSTGRYDELDGAVPYRAAQELAGATVPEQAEGATRP